MDVGGVPHTRGTVGTKEAATVALVSRERVLQETPEVPASLLAVPMAPRLGERECGLLLLQMDKVCKSLDESSAVPLDNQREADPPRLNSYLRRLS